MAELCHFYPGMTPQAYWGLTVDEYYALVEYFKAYVKAQKEANAKLRRR